MPPLTHAQCQEVRHLKCWLIDKYEGELRKERERNDSGTFKQELESETIVQSNYMGSIASFFGLENVNWRMALLICLGLVIVIWRLAEAFVWRQCGQLGGTNCHCYGHMMY